MSWLSRVFGKTPPPPPPPPNTVVVADDVAAALTAEGLPLTGAVDAALRQWLSAREAAARAPAGTIPFWLAREESPGDEGASPGGSTPPGDIEDALRERMAQRKAAEEEGDRAQGRGGTRPSD